MHDPVLFSESALCTLRHAETFLNNYKDLFKWTDKEDVLEIGCADGRISKTVLYPFVKDHLKHLLATDICEDAVKAGNGANGIPSLSFQKLDITDEADCEKYVGKFNHVFAFYVFHLIHTPDLWAKNVWKILKSEGQLFASIVLRPNLMSDTLIAQKLDKSKPWAKYIENCQDLFFNFGSRPIENISTILHNAGFFVDAIDVQTVNADFKDLNSLKGLFLSINNLLAYIPEELRQDYLDDYMEKIMKLVEYTDGIYRYELDVVSLLATKM